MKLQDRYQKIIYWSDEDGCYVGRCPGLFHGGVHGDDEMKVYKNLCQAVDEWIEILKEDGAVLPPETVKQKFSGKFFVRVNPELHQRLYVGALKEGNSLNSHVKKLLEKVAS